MNHPSHHFVAIDPGDCHQYIDTTTRRASTAPTLARDGKPYFPQSPHRVVAELRYDRDSGRNL